MADLRTLIAERLDKREKVRRGAAKIRKAQKARQKAEQAAQIQSENELARKRLIFWMMLGQLMQVDLKRAIVDLATEGKDSDAD